jgi:hypothetical protein
MPAPQPEWQPAPQPRPRPERQPGPNPRPRSSPSPAPTPATPAPATEAGGGGGSSRLGGRGGGRGRGEQGDFISLMDDLLGTASGPALALSGPACNVVFRTVRDERLTEPLLAALFWWTFTRSSNFGPLVRGLGGNPEATQMILVSHASGTRHDLLVFDPYYRDKPRVADIGPFDRENIHESLPVPSQSPLLAERLRQVDVDLEERIVARAVEEVAQTGRFGLVVMPAPREIPTCAPSPALPVRVAEGNREDPVASVGVVLLAPNNVVYATTALHALNGDTEVVSVGQASGRVIRRNSVTDSCVIQLSNHSVPRPETVGHINMFRAAMPPLYRSAEFTGVSSGHKVTQITAVDLSVMDPQHYLGSKVYTSPDTIPGDSGAALLDENEWLLGFAATRSSFDASVGFSTWTWAEQVLSVHELQYPDWCAFRAENMDAVM